MEAMLIGKKKVPLVGFMIDPQKQPAVALGANDRLGEFQGVLSFRPEHVLSPDKTCRCRCRWVIKGNLIGYPPDQSTVWTGKI